MKTMFIFAALCVLTISFASCSGEKQPQVAIAQTPVKDPVVCNTPEPAPNPYLPYIAHNKRTDRSMVYGMVYLNQGVTVGLTDHQGKEIDDWTLVMTDTDFDGVGDCCFIMQAHEVRGCRYLRMQRIFVAAEYGPVWDEDGQKTNDGDNPTPVVIAILPIPGDTANKPVVNTSDPSSSKPRVVFKDEAGL